MTTLEDYALRHLTRVEPEDLLTGAAVGRTLGISRQRVHQLRRNPSFPQPHGRIGQAIVWRKQDIERWRTT